MRYLYQVDAYRPRTRSRVRAVEGEAVLLDDTVFHPRGGGQPGDRGRFASDGQVWAIRDAEESPAGVRHLLEPGGIAPEVGREVDVEVDWARRYRFMRYHTALHVLSGVVFQRFGSGITGNQIAEAGARMDFSLPDFGRELASELIARSNEVLAQQLPVAVRFISAEERNRRPELVRVATDRRPEGEEARLIEIGNFDLQADGGTHVHSTGEVGDLRLERIENKGSKNKRLYIALDERPAPKPPGSR